MWHTSANFLLRTVQIYGIKTHTELPRSPPSPPASEQQFLEARRTPEERYPHRLPCALSFPQAPPLASDKPLPLDVPQGLERLPKLAGFANNGSRVFSEKRGKIEICCLCANSKKNTVSLQQARKPGRKTEGQFSVVELGFGWLARIIQASSVPLLSVRSTDCSFHYSGTQGAQSLLLSTRATWIFRKEARCLHTPQTEGPRQFWDMS